MRYVILALLTVVTGAISYLFYDHKKWFSDALAGNLAAGFLGSLATLFFIERSIERKRQQERTRLGGLAFRQIHSSLVRIVMLFAEMIKASAPKRFESTPPSLEELFSTENNSSLDWLDTDALTGHFDGRDWKTFADVVLSAEKDLLLSTLDRYLMALDVPLIEAIDAVANDGFVQYLHTLPKTSEQLAKAGFAKDTKLYGTAELREKFFKQLTIATKELELAGGKAVPVPTSLIREDMAPKAGQGRRKVLPEHPVIVGIGDPPPGGPPWNKNPKNEVRNAGI